MTYGDFQRYYTDQLRALGVAYEGDDFLWPHQPPWPEHSFDHPYGQAPTIANIPAEENSDWDKYVVQYYIDNAVGTKNHPTPFAVKCAEFARKRFEQNGISGYTKVDDETFLGLLTEGLYSKFLGELDPVDMKLFDVPSNDGYQYLKSDFTCMSLIGKTWPDTYMAPSIAIVRRKQLADPNFSYELVGVALAKWDDANGKYVFTKDLLFTPPKQGSHSAWWLAKLYVLQGAIHRINLVDHIRVHFPSDTINAVTKAVLPRWHLIQQLLLPHFWLSLPVNHSVLEGARSLINRDTWYPWSPLVANGNEARKIFPLGWGGSSYCWADASNTAYPKFHFSLDPDSAPNPNPEDPARRIDTYVGLKVSRFAAFQRDYFDPILNFTRGVVATLPDLTADPTQDHVLWLELQRWAHEISKLVPGFPDQHEIRDKEILAKTCAMIIWNASIVHTSDHCVLHVMIDRYPVPFIMRVPPPTDNITAGERTIGDALGEKGLEFFKCCLESLKNTLLPSLEQKLLAKLHDEIPKSSFLDPILKKALDEAIAVAIKEALKDIQNEKVTEGSLPLCWPTDLVWAKMADLLFYRPHGSSLLYDCEYAFLKVPPSSPDTDHLSWRVGTGVDDAQRDKLLALRKAFQSELENVNSKYYDKAGKPVQYKALEVGDLPCVLNEYGFPKLIPGEDDKDQAAVRMQCCFSAGIQY